MKRKQIYLPVENSTPSKSVSRKSKKSVDPAWFLVVGVLSIGALFYLIFLSGFFKAHDSFDRFNFDDVSDFVRTEEFEFDCHKIQQLNITNDVLYFDRQFEIVLATLQDKQYAFKRPRHVIDGAKHKHRLPAKFKKPSHFVNVADYPKQPNTTKIQKNIKVESVVFNILILCFFLFVWFFKKFNFNFFLFFVHLYFFFSKQQFGMENLLD